MLQKTMKNPVNSISYIRLLSGTGGQAIVLPDGGLFIKESKYGGGLRFTKDRMLWSRVNDYDDQYSGRVARSSYRTVEEAHAPLQAVASRKCSGAASARRDN